MSEPISYRLLEAVATALRDIRTANGYHTNLGTDVRVEAPIIVQGASVLFVTAEDFDRNTAAQTQRQRNSSVRVIIEAIIATGRATAQRDAHRVRADILRALFERRIVLPSDADGSSATGLNVESDIIDPRADGAAALAVRITATTNLVERIGGPTA